jgi:hypothetical protein
MQSFPFVMEFTLCRVFSSCYTLFPVCGPLPVHTLLARFCLFSCWFSPNYMKPFFLYLTSLLPSLQMKGNLGSCKSHSFWPDMLKANCSKQTHTTALHLTVSHNISVTCTTAVTVPSAASLLALLCTFQRIPHFRLTKMAVYPLQCWVKDGSALNKSDLRKVKFVLYNIT